MEMGEFPAEGWQVYLKQEEARLMQERALTPRPSTPIDPAQDIDLYYATLSPENAQLQVDWDTFVTFGEQLQMASEPRSLTPSPILPALNRPMGYPMTRASSPVAPPARTQSQRAQSRDYLKDRLRTLPLTASWHGRIILRMTERQWFFTASGFAVTRYAKDAGVWQPNDEANYLHWLDDDLRVHRSTTLRLLCVENIEVLNAILVAEGASPISPRPTPDNWQREWGSDDPRQRGLPSFLRAGYTRRKQLVSLTARLRRHGERVSRGARNASTAAQAAGQAAPQSQDAGQAARDVEAASSASPQAAPARGE